MPSKPCLETVVLHAWFDRRSRTLRATSWGHAKPLIHVNVSAMSIMIGIDETLADHAARIGTRHHDDGNNSCGAHAPCALPCGSEAFMLFIGLR